MTTHPSVSNRTIAWDYAYLIDLQAAGEGAVLLCGHVADTPEFEVECTSPTALAPYLEIHKAWRSTPDAVEPPLIPFIQTGSGRRAFSTEGAKYDYPAVSRT